MKKLISAAAGLVLAFTLAVSAFAQSEASFSDVLPGSWYYKEVTEMVSSGFIDGYGDGSHASISNGCVPCFCIGKE